MIAAIGMAIALSLSQVLVTNSAARSGREPRETIMRTYLLPNGLLPISALLITLALAGFAVSDSQAQGFHFAAGGVHVDVGSPHSYYGSYGSYYPSLNRGCGYGEYPYTTHYGGGYGVGGYGGGWGGRSTWHDTTHLDYHPGEFRRHRGHYHYVPGHYDVHEEGHWHHD
jgi:hypothetical protein